MLENERKKDLDFLFQTNCDINPEPKTYVEELESYLEEPEIESTRNPLHWWRENEERFPRIAKVARKYLAVPASSIASERVFSTAGNIMNKKRCSLSSKHLNILIFIKQNYKLVLNIWSK